MPNKRIQTNLYKKDLLLKISLFIVAIFQTSISEAKIIVFNTVVSQIKNIEFAVVNTNEPIWISENGFGIICKNENDLVDYRNRGVGFEKFAAKGGGQAESKVFLVTKEGVVLPKGAKIPGEFIQNAHRSSNYGVMQNGKFVEKLRIDPATPAGMKGPNFSHYHLNGSGKHLTGNWPWW